MSQPTSATRKHHAHPEYSLRMKTFAADQIRRLLSSDVDARRRGHSPPGQQTQVEMRDELDTRNRTSGAEFDPAEVERDGGSLAGMGMGLARTRFYRALLMIRRADGSIDRSSTCLPLSNPSPLDDDLTANHPSSNLDCGSSPSAHFQLASQADPRIQPHIHYQAHLETDLPRTSTRPAKPPWPADPSHHRSELISILPSVPWHAEAHASQSLTSEVAATIHFAIQPTDSDANTKIEMNMKQVPNLEGDITEGEFHASLLAPTYPSASDTNAMFLHEEHDLGQALAPNLRSEGATRAQALITSETLSSNAITFIPTQTRSVGTFDLALDPISTLSYHEDQIHRPFPTRVCTTCGRSFLDVDGSGDFDSAARSGYGLGLGNGSVYVFGAENSTVYGPGLPMGIVEAAQHQAHPSEPVCGACSSSNAFATDEMDLSYPGHRGGKKRIAQDGQPIPAETIHPGGTSAAQKMNAEQIEGGSSPGRSMKVRVPGFHVEGQGLMGSVNDWNEEDEQGVREQDKASDGRAIDFETQCAVQMTTLVPPSTSAPSSRDLHQRHATSRNPEIARIRCDASLHCRKHKTEEKRLVRGRKETFEVCVARARLEAALRKDAVEKAARARLASKANKGFGVKHDGRVAARSQVLTDGRRQVIRRAITSTSSHSTASSASAASPALDLSAGQSPDYAMLTPGPSSAILAMPIPGTMDDHSLGATHAHDLLAPGAVLPSSTYSDVPCDNSGDGLHRQLQPHEYLIEPMT